MWIWWTKINRNPSILGRLSVIKWRNWTWWESYLNTEISDETQIAIVIGSGMTTVLLSKPLLYIKLCLVWWSNIFVHLFALYKNLLLEAFYLFVI